MQLTPLQQKIFVFISENPSAQVSEIAAMLGEQPGSVKWSINSLVGKGYITPMQRQILKPLP